MDRKQYQQDVANVDAQFQPIFDSNAIDPEGLSDDGAIPEISFATPTMSARDARELKTTIENQALANEMLELQGDGFDLRAPAPVDVAFERVGLNGKPITRAAVARSESELERTLSAAADAVQDAFFKSLGATPTPTAPATSDRAFYQKLTARADPKSHAGRFVRAMAAGDRNAARKVIREVVHEDGIRA